jgi:hypothetical protein
VSHVSVASVKRVVRVILSKRFSVTRDGGMRSRSLGAI